MSESPLDRKLSASEQVRRHLEREISNGMLLPGDTLDEAELAKRFAVSRTPVREALLHLSVRGLVTIAPRAGIYVSRLSIPDLVCLTELMAELEGSCTKFATRRLTIAESNQLKSIHEASAVYELELDAVGYARANADFHEILYRACRNNALMSEIAHIRRRTQVYRQSGFLSLGRIQRSREEHGRILTAILAGDAVAAGQLMTDHISIGGVDLAEFLATVPPQLLATEVDYPGKQEAEQSRAMVLQKTNSVPNVESKTRNKKLKS